jgi:hypothetical protein
MMSKWDRAPLVLTAAFVLLVLALNASLFTRPVVEIGDYAANSLLVHEAKHFRLMTGHYSRWRFQHPGPAFLYLFALGEFVFYDLLHVVPAPYNGQLLITILFNGALLAAALYVIRRHVRFSVPLALLATALVTVMVNRTGPPSMLISNWMPDVLLFPFLLFAVSAASVLAGETRHLPLLAFSGMLLIHAHFAQFLFVGVIGGVTVACILGRALWRGSFRQFLSENWRAFAAAAAIVFIFAFPPLLELLVDRPNNLDALRNYLHHYGDAHNPAGQAMHYFACFLLFMGKPQIGVTTAVRGILAMSFSPRWVTAYWAILLSLGMLALIRVRRPPPFLVYMGLVWAVCAALFVYWGTRIAGDFYPFNGTFIYSLHLLAWFLVLAWLAPQFGRRNGRRVEILALAAVLTLAAIERGALETVAVSQPEDLRAALAVPAAPFGTLDLAFDQKQWPQAIAVANEMTRLDKPFCVNPGWGFMFLQKNVCPDLPRAAKLRMAASAVSCDLPCRYVYHGAAFSLIREPAKPVSLPWQISAGDLPWLDRSGFDESEPVYCWTQQHASIWFWLSADTPRASCYRLAVTGIALPGRPAQLSLNGQLLGILSKAALETSAFVVPAQAIRPGAANHISLDTEKAGPVGHDPRELGFDFVSLALRAPTAQEGCPSSF